MFGNYESVTASMYSKEIKGVTLNKMTGNLPLLVLLQIARNVLKKAHVPGRFAKNGPVI